MSKLTIYHGLESHVAGKPCSFCQKILDEFEKDFGKPFPLPVKNKKRV